MHMDVKLNETTRYLTFTSPRVIWLSRELAEDPPRRQIQLPVESRNGPLIEAAVARAAWGLFGLIALHHGATTYPSMRISPSRFPPCVYGLGGPSERLATTTRPVCLVQ